MPKLPPPPRTPQKRSAFSSALAFTNSPSAVTRSTETSWSIVSPCLRMIQPMPPPSVSPATPVCVTMPDGTASPNACVSWSSSPSRTPACTRAVRASGSTRMPFIGERSITSRRRDRQAREGVPAAAHGDRQAALLPEPHGGDHVRDAGAASDQRRDTCRSSRSRSCGARRSPEHPGEGQAHGTQFRRSGSRRRQRSPH